MAKKSNKDANGTSFHDSVISASVNQLIEAFGEPTYENNDGSDKVNFEWEMETEDEEVFTIYDWKEYRRISKDEIIEWHIGGHSVEVTEKAAEEIEESLSNLQD
jgi:hypothetical protein